MSNRRAIALSFMLGLHRVDDFAASGKESCKVVGPPRDFVEAEERRRTFWYLYFSDRWVAAGSAQVASIMDDQVRSEAPKDGVN